MDEILASLQNLLSCGAFDAGARYIANLPVEVRQSPRVALKCARFRARQGYVNDALALLDGADMSAGELGVATLIGLERTAIGILRDVDIAEAARTAQAFLLAAEPSRPSDADAAESVSIGARIIQMAYVYYEIDADAAEFARERLAQAADALETADRVEEALNARHNLADWPRDTADTRVAALEGVARRASALGWPNNAAQALIATATIRVQADADVQAVAMLLDAAREAFAQATNSSGALDVERVRLLLAQREGRTPSSDLEGLIEKYLATDRPRDALSVLIDLSQQMHEQGRIARARELRVEIVQLCDRTGLLLSRASSEIAGADILMRARKLADAIDVCLAALERPAPRIVCAQVKQILSSAYSFAGDTEKAVSNLKDALRTFEDLHAGDLASIAATALANQLMGKRTDEAYAEARALTDRWLEEGVARGDIAEALQSLSLSVQGRWQNYIFAPPEKKPVALLVEAERLLVRGEELAAKLPERAAAKARGDISQLRGMVRSAQEIPNEPETGYRVAAEEYDKGGYAMEAANSRYMVGVVRLNAAADALRADQRQAFLEHFGECERNLNAALEYYLGADMRLEAAKARFMLARHYQNSSPAAPPELASKMREAALVYLHQGFADLDAARREFASGKTTDAQIGKLTFAGETSKIVELALEILAPLPGREGEAWNWAQNGKSRALTDLLGVFAKPPQRLLDEIAKDAQAADALADANALAARLQTAGPQDRPALRLQLEQADAAMATDSRFANYLAFVKGAPVALEELPTLFENGEIGARAGACVDWIKIGDSLRIIVARPGASPKITPVGISLGKVKEFLDAHMSEAHFRSTLRDNPDLLWEMSALIAPLGALTAPEELLILSPTSVLHSLPLHALMLGGKPLIARNPILYSYSLGVTRHAVMRRTAPVPPEPIAVFGDPNGDRPPAREMAKHLAAKFGVPPLFCQAATRDAFLNALSRARNVHFQGHAVYVGARPLDSFLQFAGEKMRLTAEEILGEMRIASEQISLGACESAANEIRAGDEPLGLIPAFQLAGARSVVAALWPVESSSCANFMSAYYEGVMRVRNEIPKADALREAALAMMNDKIHAAPYYWAAYVLHGDWR